VAPPQSDYGGVLNYDLLASSALSSNAGGVDFSGASASLDGRAFGPFGVLSQSAIVGATPNRGTDALRLDTSWTYSDLGTLMTYRAGDTISGGLPWTRPLRIGGLQIQRDFGLRPDLVTFPLPVVSGTAAVPSVLEVYVDGLMTHSQELVPGPYEISNVPVLSGEGTARVIVRDAAGRRTETDLPFYATSKLLRRGIYDFSLEAGWPRTRFGTDSNAYGEDLVMSLTARGGLFDWLSLEAHAEASEALLNGGIGAVVRLGFSGVLSLAGSASRTSDMSGFQSYVAYDLQTQGVNVHASSLRTFGNYADLGSVTAETLLPPHFDPAPIVGGAESLRLFAATRPPRALDAISIGVPLFASSQLDFGYLHQRLDDGTRSGIASVSLSRPVLDNGSLYLSAFSDVDDRSKYGVFVGLSVQLGGIFADDSPIWASTGLSTAHDGTNVTADVGRSIQPDEDSFGWRLYDREGSSPLRAASATYRSSFAQFDAGIQQSNDDAEVVLQASGAIATLGGGAFFANRIDDAFAVADAGAPGVHVLQENRTVGVTDAHGLLLIPRLRAYELNHVSIDVRDLPVNADAPITKSIVTPQSRSGVLVDFGVKRDVKAAVVILADKSGKFIEPGTGGRLDGSEAAFVVGYDGRAFVQGLQDMNTVVVDDANGACRATFPFVPLENNQVVIGPLTCQ
jgi:outer membrane usher protein